MEIDRRQRGGHSDQAAEDQHRLPAEAVRRQRHQRAAEEGAEAERAHDVGRQLGGEVTRLGQVDRDEGEAGDQPGHQEDRHQRADQHVADLQHLKDAHAGRRHAVLVEGGLRRLLDP